MNNDIKEILDNPKILMLSYGNYISIDDYVKLKDYITNLQKTQETLIKNDNEIITNLQEEKDKEIDRLNNIINELEKILIYEKNNYNGNLDIETHNIDSEFLRGNSWEADYILDKLKKLKENK